MFFGRKASVSSLSMGDAQKELSADPAIRLLDVRTDEEYDAGHIPGSIHLPLHQIGRAPDLIDSKDARVFVYCLSGARSQQACGQLARLGYTNVTNIGGIIRWPGKIEKAVRV